MQIGCSDLLGKLNFSREFCPEVIECSLIVPANVYPIAWRGKIKRYAFARLDD